MDLNVAPALAPLEPTQCLGHPKVAHARGAMMGLQYLLSQVVGDHDLPAVFSHRWHSSPLLQDSVMDPKSSPL
ncbi:UNVERIFIED_CONTAM: hypothetical protein FKN15_006923 [Acipenser sinensis]